MGKSGQPGSIPKRSRLRDRDSNQTRQTAFLLSPSPDKREGPVEETPSGAAQPAKDQDRKPPFHGACLRRVSTSLASVFGAFPQGSIGRERPPKGRGQAVEHRL